LAGGACAPLPEGARLCPALPPPGPVVERGRVDRRAMQIDGLRVGAAVLSLRVAVEVEGVQVEVTHVSGELARLVIVLPRPSEFAFASRYVDWVRSEDPSGALEVECRPGEPPHVLFGRFEPRDPRWPTLLPERLSAPAQNDGLWLVVGAQ